MEIGDIKQDELTCWAGFGEDAEVLLRYISRDELDRIRRRVTKQIFKRGQMFEDTDSMQFNVLLGRAAVRGWRNITVGGKPFQFSPENCDLLMNRSYEFSDFINEKCVEISAFIEEEEAKSGKKSGPTPDGG